MKRILGVDPGLANTGWGVLDADGTRLVHIDHGTISTVADTEEQERLFIIFSGITELIQRYRPSLLGVEALYFAKNRKSAIPVAQARGVVLVAAAKEGVHAESHTPQDIKQALTGNGRAEKHQVQEMVRLLLGIEQIPKPDHAADALAAAICCYHLHQFSAEEEKAKKLKTVGRRDVS
ncbi:MAG: crossover junction endodeoxyribonuclease RuvC [Spirochaetaceae bacterium]